MARWTNSIDIDKLEIYGCQESDADTTFYYTNSNNLKKTSKGLGLSMNLHNNASSSLGMELYIYSPNALGNNVYGTYQHARHSNATLAISKSYSFSSSGLGGVVYFSNSTYRSYYDEMQEVSV